VAGDSYGILLNSYFDGATGMRLQERGNKDAVIVGLFLTANEFTNMIGLYELSIAKIERKLPIVKTRAALRKALEVLDEESYAHYDTRTEFVWVREMARVRLQLKGTPLSTGDKRVLGANKVYSRLPLNPFLGPFYDRYGLELRLPKRRHGGPLDIEGASQAPSQAPSQGASQGASPDRGSKVGKGLAPTLRSHQLDQRSGTSDQVPEISDQVPVKAAAAPPHPHEQTRNHGDNLATVETLTTLIRREVFPLLGAAASYTDVKDAAAELCSKNGMRWQIDDMRKAIESSQYRDTLATLRQVMH
jgi:hypothetical protein